MYENQTNFAVNRSVPFYLSCNSPLAVAGEEVRYATGLILEDESAFLISDSAVSQSTPDSSILSSTSIPQSCDLSTSVYFPPIQDQGSVGSCTAFAMGYYQFTYEKKPSQRCSIHLIQHLGFSHMDLQHG